MSLKFTLFGDFTETARAHLNCYNIFLCELIHNNENMFHVIQNIIVSIWIMSLSV